MDHLVWSIEMPGIEWDGDRGLTGDRPEPEPSTCISPCAVPQVPVQTGTCWCRCS